MKDTRKKLINLARGGNGRISPWIEQRGPDAYIVHLPLRFQGGKEIQIQMGSEEAANGLIKALETGAKPAAPPTE